jgi:regulator of sirC expression with transglutaminase-like and TPR domain
MDAALLHAWTHVVGGSVADADLDLAACALLIAELERPGLPADDYLRRLDQLARGVGERSVDAAARYLFVDHGFRGNADDYYDPRNSCLDQVIDRRLGIPITLSVVFLEVGWRLGLDVAGIGFPGHFLVRAREGGAERVLDPFRGGVTLDEEAQGLLLAQALGPRAVLAPQHVRPVGKREILARMLNNLRGIYLHGGRTDRVAEVRALLTVLHPSPPAPGAQGAPN